MSLEKQLEYSVVDLAEVIRDEPALIRDHLRAISRLLERGQIEPLPARVFEFDDAPLAFRYMAQAKHIGKIVLRHPGGLRVTADATYLITGGLGAIGLRIGQWLLDCGAKTPGFDGTNASREPCRHSCGRDAGDWSPNRDTSGRYLWSEVNYKQFLPACATCSHRFAGLSMRPAS